ncbi:hypothetical protein CLOP_g10586 [Closterium sp. NIES-67]|nr:hypothetical protein CLOP_g10586 [Closterium sp. NIES-67]
MEIYFAAVGWSSPVWDSQRVRLAATLMRGPALEWIGGNSTFIHGEATWQEFRADLLKRFEPINSSYFAREKIHRHRQFGSVVQYTQQMEEFYNRILDLTEEEKVQSYLAGLKTEVKRQVAASNYASYSDVVLAAERFDMVNAGTRRTHVGSTRQGDRSAHPTFADPMEVDRFEGRPCPKNTNYTCDFCGVPGHRIFDCSKMKAARAEYRARNSGGIPSANQK